MSSVNGSAVQKGPREYVSNLGLATSMLSAHGIEYTAENAGSHIIISVPGDSIDYYPLNGNFEARKSKKKGNGLFNLIKVIEGTA